MRRRKGRGPFRRHPGGRRPLQPHGPRRPGRPQLNPRLQRELKRANHLMQIGDHLNAATIFISLAERALDRGILHPAAMLQMQAAHALLLAEDLEASKEQAQLGLDSMRAEARWGPLKREGERYIDTLDGEGHEALAAEMQAWLAAQLGDHAQGAADAEQESEGRIPEKCPYCGASMSLEQVSSRGLRAAECQYCGSVVLPSQMD